MPISYRIDAERNLVLAEAHGVLTDDDIINFRKRLLEDPAFQPGMHELSDYRRAERHELTTEGLQRFIEHDKSVMEKLGSDYRIAIVTRSDLHFGFSRMYIAGVSDILPEVQVFRDIDEAEAWLTPTSNKAK
jgi:hypothetical protein